MKRKLREFWEILKIAHEYKWEFKDDKIKDNKGRFVWTKSLTALAGDFIPVKEDGVTTNDSPVGFKIPPEFFDGPAIEDDEWRPVQIYINKDGSKILYKDESGVINQEVEL